MRSIALANQKGGVGKTTTAIHLAHGLSLAGAKVVLFDLDPQGNASVAIEAMTEAGGKSPGPLSGLRRADERFWILPSPGEGRSVAPDAMPDTKMLLALAKELESEVDWLLVDCPPRMDAWGWAGLRLCDQVLMPVQAEFFSMHGLSNMVETLREARTKHPGKADLMGVLVTMLDAGEPVSQEILEDLKANLGSHLIDTVIFRDPALVEAASHGRTVFDYRLCSKGARSYGELVREVLHG